MNTTKEFQKKSSDIKIVPFFPLFFVCILFSACSRNTDFEPTVSSQIDRSSSATHTEQSLLTLGDITEEVFPIQEIKTQYGEQVSIYLYDGKNVYFSVYEENAKLDLYRYNAGNGEIEFLSALPPNSLTQQSMCHDNNLVICLGFADSFSIFRIDINMPNDEPKEIFSEAGQRWPIVSLSPNGVIVNNEQLTDNVCNNRIFLLSYDGKSKTDIYETDYTVDSDGNCTGEIIWYSGGMEDAIYFQVSKMNNTIPEMAQSSVIVRASIENEEVFCEPVHTVDNKIYIYVSGTNDDLILSEYGYEEPASESGKIISMDNPDKPATVIKQIQSGNDIRSSMMISPTQCVLLCMEGLYVVDLDSGTYVEQSLKRTSEFGMVTAQVTKNGFFYVRAKGDSEKIEMFLCQQIYEQV